MTQSRIPSLVAADGCFHSRVALVRLLLRRKVSAQDVVREARAQIDALRGLGIAATHWDTHQHVAGAATARESGGSRSEGGRHPPRAYASGVDRECRRRAVRSPLALARSNPRRVAGEAARAVVSRVVSRMFATPAFRAAPQPCRCTLADVPGAMGLHPLALASRDVRGDDASRLRRRPRPRAHPEPDDRSCARPPGGDQPRHERSGRRASSIPFAGL